MSHLGCNKVSDLAISESLSCLLICHLHLQGGPKSKPPNRCHNDCIHQILTDLQNPLNDTLVIKLKAIVEDPAIPQMFRFTTLY